MSNQFGRIQFKHGTAIPNSCEVGIFYVVTEGPNTGIYLGVPSGTGAALKQIAASPLANNAWDGDQSFHKGVTLDGQGGGTGLTVSGTPVNFTSATDVQVKAINSGETDKRAATVSYVDKSIEALGTVFVYRGSLDTYAELEALDPADLVEGDVYYVKDRNAAYIWADVNPEDGTYEWDELGSFVDLSNYPTLNGTNTFTGNNIFNQGITAPKILTDKVLPYTSRTLDIQIDETPNQDKPSAGTINIGTYNSVVDDGYLSPIVNIGGGNNPVNIADSALKVIPSMDGVIVNSDTSETVYSGSQYVQLISGGDMRIHSGYNIIIDSASPAGAISVNSNRSLTLTSDTEITSTVHEGLYVQHTPTSFTISSREYTTPSYFIVDLPFVDDDLQPLASTIDLSAGAISIRTQSVQPCTRMDMTTDSVYFSGGDPGDQFSVGGFNNITIGYNAAFSSSQVALGGVLEINTNRDITIRETDDTTYTVLTTKNISSNSVITALESRIAALEAQLTYQE